MILLWNYFNINFIYFILLKEIFSDTSKQIIYLKVKRGMNVKVVNSFFIPSKVYINGIESNINSNGNIKIDSFYNANVTLEWDEKMEKYNKLFSNINSIIEADLSHFDTSKVVSLAYMFNNCENLEYANFANINTSLINDLSFMFENCYSLKRIDLSDFDTRNVVNMEGMFKNCESLYSLNLSNFYTPKLRRMNDMFYGCGSLEFLDISNMDTSRVTYMNSTFDGCLELNGLDLSNFNTKNVILMDSLFKFCSSLTSLNLSSFDTSNVINMSYMFYETSELVTLDITNFNTSKVEYMDYMFFYCNLDYLNFSNFNTSQAISMSNMFSRSNFHSLDLTSFSFNQVNLDYFFFGCYSLTSIKFSREYKLAGSIYSMFYGCNSLVSLDLYNFDFALVDNMESLFYFCQSLTSLDLSNIDSYSLTNMDYMFIDCENIEYINFSNFITSSVTSMEGLFYNCRKLTSINLSSFDTFNVINMSKMFYLCRSLKSINLVNLDTSSVTDMSKMFYGCSSLESLNISNFNTSLVQSIDDMFSSCENLTSLDLSNFHFQYLTKIDILLNGNSKLEFINISDFSKGNFEYDNIFEGVEKNIVYCLNLYNGSKNIIPEKLNNNCSVNDCSKNWKNKRKKIIVETGTCLDNCHLDEINKFEYENKCYEQCPKGTHSIKDKIFSCEKNSDNCESNYPFIEVKTNICLEECNPLDFFNNLCTINLINNKQEQIKIQYDLVQNLTNAIEINYQWILYEVLLINIDLIHSTNNTIYQITSSFNQKNNNYNNISALNIADCETILRKNYDIKSYNDLIIFKIEHYYEELNIPLIQYEIFNSDDYQKLNLNDCINNNILVNISIPSFINENDSDKYDPNSDYYNDICYLYITESGTDISLYDRKNEYNNNYYLCQKDCSFIKHDFKNKKYICSCRIKDGFSFEEEIKKEELISTLINKKRITNFNVLKCFKLLTSKNGWLLNLGNYLILFMVSIYIVAIFVFCFREYKEFYEFFNDIINGKIFKNNIESDSKIDLKGDSFNNKVGKKISKEKYKDSIITLNNVYLENNIDSKSKFYKYLYLKNKLKYKINERQIQLIFESIDYEINTIPFQEALNTDQRTYFQYYLSLIKSRHILFFIFNLITDDYNSRIIKICILFFSIPLQLVVNAIFFNDYILHQIYIDKGVFNLGYIFPQIIYSIIITSIIITIIKSFSLTQHNILDIKHGKSNCDLNIRVILLFRKIKFKFISFFVLSFLFLILFWIYLSCFCAVYINTQLYLLKTFLISYLLFIIIPFILFIFPGLFRFFSFRKPGECIYKASQLILLL